MESKRDFNSFLQSKLRQDKRYGDNAAELARFYVHNQKLIEDVLNGVGDEKITRTLVKDYGRDENKKEYNMKLGLKNLLYGNLFSAKTFFSQCSEKDEQKEVFSTACKISKYDDANLSGLKEIFQYAHSTEQFARQLEAGK